MTRCRSTWRWFDILLLVFVMPSSALLCWTVVATMTLLGTTGALAATWYVSSSGSGTACTSGTPCAISYAIATKSANGDTVIVNSGTYTDSTVTVSKGITLTADPSVVSALGAFTRGIPGGTDNRPYFSAAHFDLTAQNAIVSYMRIRNSASRHEGDYDGVVAMSAENTRIDHSEIWNGNQGVSINRKRNIVVDNNYIHTCGIMNSSLDSHGVQYYASGTIATSYAEGVRITNNTIYDIGGDHVQLGSAAYGDGQPERYTTIDNNRMDLANEQSLDVKGGSYIIFSNNDVSQQTQGAIVSTWDPPTVAMHDWEIFNNIIHDTDGYAFTFAQSEQCDAVHMYNNVIYNTNRSPPYNQVTVTLCGTTSTFQQNTVVNNVRTSGSNKVGGVAGCRNNAAVRNNIFYNNGSGSDYGNLMSSYYGCTTLGTPGYNYVNPTTPGIAGNNSVSTCYTTGNCPKFVDINGADFRLSSGSSAIDIGTTLGGVYATDRLGVARPQGAAFDAGAYEFGTGLLPAPTGFHRVDR